MNENQTPQSEALFDAEFGREMVKSIVLSTTATVGVLAGFLIVGQAIVIAKDLKAKRLAKKTAQEN